MMIMLDHEALKRRIEEAVLREREECAREAEKAVQYHYGYSGDIIANAIRKRKAADATDGR